MPMIDVYAPSASFTDPHQLARDLARTLMTIEGVPDIPMFRQNTAAFVHALADDAASNVDGDSASIRVQVLTNFEALDRAKQLAVVSQFTDLVIAAVADASASPRVWVLLTEAVNGGWGLNGHAHTNAELVDAARAQIAELASDRGPQLP
jgi:phenylpyruvate tautomerase PptA (4-oxalocrotonate tautomerase family)